MSIEKVVNNYDAANITNTYEQSLLLNPISVFSVTTTTNIDVPAAPTASVSEAGPTRLAMSANVAIGAPVQTYTITYGNYPSSVADADKPTDVTHAVFVHATGSTGNGDQTAYTGRITSDSSATALVIVVSRVTTDVNMQLGALDIEIRKRGLALASS